jgi:allantoate deiminase
MNTLSSLQKKTYAKRALLRCEILSKISELKGAILRQYLTPEHKACNQQVSEWMADAGMKTWQDTVGNQWGRLVSSTPNAPVLIIGSHLDTVPNAGAYDGILGVMLAIELVGLATLNHVEFPFHIDVVGFCDEEGTRFGTTLIGSKALAGQFNPDWLNIIDTNNMSMADAMIDFGLDPKAYQQASLLNKNVNAYWEVHIEQGPVLEKQEQPIGIVTAIAGAKRAEISFIGMAGHAGTTPMNMRLDALTAAAELTLTIEKIAQQSCNNEVATVGTLKAKPGATNVIAGYSELSLDARAQTEEDLSRLIHQIKQQANQIATKRNIEMQWKWTHAAKVVACDKTIQDVFKQASELNHIKAPSLPSGAGHDAMAVADICPVAMLFIRSPKGISHHPDETVITDDVEKALAVMYSALLLVAS